MFKIFKKKDSYIEETQIRPWVINRYTSLKNQGFTEEEISDCVILNDAERKEMDIMYGLKDSVENLIDKMVGTSDLKEEPVKESVKESVKEAKENNEVVDAEPVKEPVVEEETIKESIKEAKENNEVVDVEPVKESVVEEPVKESVVEEPVKESVKEESVKESVKEEDPSKWTDEEVIEKALHDLTDKMEYQDKEQMSDLLRESFNSDKQLVDLYRNKYLSHYKLVNNNLSNNDNKSTENKEEGGEKEDKKEVIESKEEKVINEDKDNNNKINDLNIDNEMFEMLVDDVFDQYKMIFNIKKDKLKDLIKKVLQEKPEILKSTNYYFVCMRLCEIIENLIMENTIEDNEEDDELLNQLNSLVD